ncbi:hypothetical protein VTN00DRAFT_4820 [Thermoascus crustaceus]|uniref:uncharacterized protein n=1 Tax=Thermoascus crustaceus TaxID=5088 RepID=UPI0037431172
MVNGSFHHFHSISRSIIFIPFLVPSRVRHRRPLSVNSSTVVIEQMHSFIRVKKKGRQGQGNQEKKGNEREREISCEMDVRKIRKKGNGNTKVRNISQSKIGLKVPEIQVKVISSSRNLPNRQLAVVSFVIY